MSASEIRELMKLFESYESRVQQITDAVENAFKNIPPKNEAEIIRQIETEAQRNKTVEYGLKDQPKSSAWKEFVKDVRQNLRGKIKIAKKPSAKAKQSISKGEIHQLGMKMMEFAGEVFPDGDPIDLLIPYIKKQGWNVDMALKEIVPIAAKVVLGKNSYNEYLADMWDDVYADAKSDYETYMNSPPEKQTKIGKPTMYNALGGSNAKNPWR